MPVATGSLSHNLQLDGEVMVDKAKYSFERMYAEQDIIYTLDEIFPRAEVKCTLVPEYEWKP